MPGVCCTVAEQIESLARIAGPKVAARIRREPDELVMRIVAGWSERIDAKRARRTRLQGGDDRSTTLSARISRTNWAVKSRVDAYKRCGLLAGRR